LRGDMDCQGSSFGDAQLTDASVGTVSGALSTAKELPEQEQAAAFVNHLLAQMIVEPPKSAVDVAGLSDDGVAPLVACAADLLGLSKGFSALSSDMPPRERLYRAYRNYYKQLFGGVMKAMRPAMPDMSLAALGTSTLLDSMKFISEIDRVNELISSGIKQMASINFKLIEPTIPKDFLSIGSQLGAYSDLTTSLQGLAQAPIESLTRDLINIKLPEPYLSEALFRSGLNSPIIHTPSYIYPELEPIETEADFEARADEAIRRRMVDAYDILIALEMRMRELIERKLSAHRGNGWWRQSVPPQVRTDCQQRKLERETLDSLSHPPIAYSYIGDLKDIIVRGDNWEQVFKAVFGNKTRLEAMFMLLEPVRKDIAHSRQSSDDEYQEFVVAANWIQRVANRALSSDG
jgi:hypothetical protein